MLKPARELRYRYALHLARIGHLDSYLSIYQQFYQGLDVAKLDCLALQAELDAGRETRVVNRAIELWTVGESQVEECNPVFQFLGNQNHLHQTQYIRRFELAIDAREFSIARWLGKSIDQRHIDIASQWIAAQRNPESFVRDDKKWTKANSPWATAADCAWPLAGADRGGLTRLCRLYQPTGGIGPKGLGYACPGESWCGSSYDRLGNPRFTAQVEVWALRRAVWELAARCGNLQRGVGMQGAARAGAGTRLTAFAHTPG